MGSSLLYVLASGIFRFHEKPYVLGGLCIIGGYLAAALRGDRRYDDPEFRRQLQDWQYQRLSGLVLGRGVR